MFALYNSRDNGILFITQGSLMHRDLVKLHFQRELVEDLCLHDSQVAKAAKRPNITDFVPMHTDDPRG